MPEERRDLPRGVRMVDGVMTARVADLVEYEDNPREQRDFDYAQNPSFRSLVDSIDENGVLEPLRVFKPGDGARSTKLHMLTGHRRKRAVEKVNELRTAAWREQKRLGTAGGDAPNLITEAPITLLPPPPGPYERMASMWTAELLHEDWPVRRLFEFFSKTWERAPLSSKTDPKRMAKDLGIPVTRVKLFKTIMESDALRAAAVSLTKEPLPVSGREKTLRSIIRCADVLNAERPAVVRTATGKAPGSPQAIEQARGLLIKKAREYADREDLGSGAGVLLERTAPLLRDGDAYPDSEVAEWLTGAGVLAKDEVARKRARRSAAQHVAGESRLMADVKAHIRERPGRMNEDDLQAYADDLQAVADFMGEAARKAREALTRKLQDAAA